MNKTRGLFSLTLMALISGLVIHGAFVACTGSGSPGAGAQSAACQQWAFTTISGGDTGSQSLVPGPPFTLSDGTQRASTLAPEGWEPVAHGLSTTGTVYLFRRCAR